MSGNTDPMYLNSLIILHFISRGRETSPSPPTIVVTVWKQ